LQNKKKEEREISMPLTSEHGFVDTHIDRHLTNLRNTKIRRNIPKIKNTHEQKREIEIWTLR
jgi:hypothetical protein